ncbi:PRONE domain containing protein [Forsythia ovata]|uniref:PRONE domain containing protein n=1 Tax=Forsythia ovata TaxID=205694 RepID=A0ABD1SPB5_9LAMI
MDNISNSDENYEMGYHHSPYSLDQTYRSPAETPSYSILSRDSFAYCRTNSETRAELYPLPTRLSHVRQSSARVLKTLSLRRCRLGVRDRSQAWRSVVATITNGCLSVLPACWGSAVAPCLCLLKSKPLLFLTAKRIGTQIQLRLWSLTQPDQATQSLYRCSRIRE